MIGHIGVFPVEEMLPMISGALALLVMRVRAGL
jgi:hypothetical protein